jgi:crotonobetaine/carnitine-CoA ligase
MFDGYFEDAEATLRAFRGLWWHTGDQFRRDAEGRYWYVGRGRDLIRRRGENVSVYELENLVATHEKLVEAAAVGVPSELGEHDILVVVVPREGAVVTTEELQSFCEEIVPRYMRPDRIVIWYELLPKTSTGKVDKPVLVEMIGEPSAAS